MTSPLPSLGTVVELLGPDPESARWDATDWGNVDQGWDTPGWRDITGLAMSAEVEWGADRQVGVLSVAAAGRWTARSYDPLRLLDPSNTASPLSSALRPGTPVRLRYGAIVVRQGWVDTITYSHADRTGELRGSDAIPLLVQARVKPAGSGIPTTLRALARYLVALAKVPVTVEDDPPDGDPVVGPTPSLATDGTVGLWDWLVQAASDSLRAAWAGPQGVLHFQPYGEPRDLGLTVGGDGIPVEDLVPSASLDAVYNVVSAADAVAPNARTEVRDVESVTRYGERRLDRDRLTPSSAAWAANVLSDRRRASLDYQPRVLRLRDVVDLQALVDAGMADTVRVRVDSADPPVAVAATLLGMSMRVDPESGWSADVVCYVPAATWEDAYVPEPVPPDPVVPPPTTTRVTRTYTCAKDSRLAYTSGGSNYGSGTEGQLPVGSGSGWKNRAVLDFATIDWTGVVAVVSATLRLTTSSQVNLAFGSSPKVECRRITGSWSEGSSSSPSGSNAVVWPGPATTTTGASQATVTRTEGARIGLSVTAIARAWAPVAAGGSGATRRGIAIYSAAESDASKATEFLSRETGSSGSRPVLELVLDIAS